MKCLILLLLLPLSIPFYTQSNLPSWFVKSFKELKLDEGYEIKGYLKPSYLQTDFNGDGITDIAILVIERKTKKKGILIIHGRSNQYFVFGAGKKFGNGGNDFKWAGGWKIYSNKTAYEMVFDDDGGMSGSKKIRLSRKAFFIYDLEDGQPNPGGIIYWNGKKYVWIHQGE